jgi:hypothetical protein
VKIDHDLVDRVDVEGSPAEIAGLIEWIEREIHVADQVAVTSVDAGPGQLRLTVVLDRVQGQRLAGKLHVMAACGDRLAMDDPTIEWLADASIGWLEANGQSLAGSERARLRAGLRDAVQVRAVDSQHCCYCGKDLLGQGFAVDGQRRGCWPLCLAGRTSREGQR